MQAKATRNADGTITMILDQETAETIWAILEIEAGDDTLNPRTRDAAQKAADALDPVTERWT